MTATAEVGTAAVAQMAAEGGEMGARLAHVEAGRAKAGVEVVAAGAEIPQDDRAKEVDVEMAAAVADNMKAMAVATNPMSSAMSCSTLVVLQHRLSSLALQRCRQTSM